jgi:hypothetical protein
MIKCEHCQKEYETYSEFEKDCFVSSDGWTFEYFHNCLKERGIEIHGYKNRSDSTEQSN